MLTEPFQLNINRICESKDMVRMQSNLLDDEDDELDELELGRYGLEGDEIEELELKWKESEIGFFCTIFPLNFVF